MAAEAEPTIQYSVRDLLARIDLKLDQVTDRLDGRVEEHDRRITLLEQDVTLTKALSRQVRRWVLVGVPSFVGFAVGVTTLIYRFVH